MSTGKTVVVFYHSAICPRCGITRVMLRRVLQAHPEVEVRHVEILTNWSQARRAGVTSVPALVAQGRSLGGIVLTQRMIERFLESLTPAALQPGFGTDARAWPVE